jgi:hypothetical protein
VVSLDSAGTPLAWPGLPRLKLWRDAAEAFGHDSDKLDRAIEGMEKFHIPLNKTSVRRALPLSRVYVLDNAPDGETPRIKPLSGKEALQAIMVNTYRRNFVKQMGLTRESFLRAATVVRSISVFEAARKRGFDVFENEAARLERHFKEGAIEPEMALAAGEKETSRWKR